MEENSSVYSMEQAHSHSQKVHLSLEQEKAHQSLSRIRFSQNASLILELITPIFRLEVRISYH